MSSDKECIHCSPHSLVRRPGVVVVEDGVHHALRHVRREDGLLHNAVAFVPERHQHVVPANWDARHNCSRDATNANLSIQTLRLLNYGAWGLISVKGRAKAFPATDWRWCHSLRISNQRDIFDLFGSSQLDNTLVRMSHRRTNSERDLATSDVLFLDTPSSTGQCQLV